jgi:hypothetical protein
MSRSLHSLKIVLFSVKIQLWILNKNCITLVIYCMHLINAWNMDCVSLDIFFRQLLDFSPINCFKGEGFPRLPILSFKWMWLYNMTLTYWKAQNNVSTINCQFIFFIYLVCDYILQLFKYAMLIARYIFIEKNHHRVKCRAHNTATLER